MRPWSHKITAIFFCRSHETKGCKSRLKIYDKFTRNNSRNNHCLSFRTNCSMLAPNARGPGLHSYGLHIFSAPLFQNTLRAVATIIALYTNAGYKSQKKHFFITVILAKVKYDVTCNCNYRDFTRRSWHK